MFSARMVSGRPFHSSNWKYDIIKVILLYNGLGNGPVFSNHLAVEKFKAALKPSS